MEFRTCPSCKASVLEDDVADCPFCGASMSGKPSAKPAPKAGAGPAKPSVAGGSKPSVAKGPAAEKTPAAGAARTRPAREPEPEERAEDTSDPFEVDPLAHKMAVQVSVKQGKGRTVEVKCPMCETVGFIAPSQAGKDVKCCNPSCRLPIFKAPKLPPEVVAEPEKPKGLSTLMLSVIGLMVFALGGGGIYWFLQREEPKPVPVQVPDVPVNPVPTDPVTPPVDPNVVVLPPRHVVSTVAEIRTLAAEELLKVTAQRDFRSRHYGKQLAAESLLTVGNLSGAKEQIASMGAAGGTYAVGPLATLAQLQLAAGDKAGAETALKEALTLSEKLPDVGRTPLDAIAILASALVQFDRSPEAAKLLSRYARKDGEVRGSLSLFWRSSLDRGTFDFGRESSLSHLELCGKHLWVSTALQLCRHQQWDKAEAWAKSAPDQVTRDATLAACAGMIASRSLHAPDPALETRLKTLADAAELAAKVRILVAAAEVRFQAGNKSVTKATATEIEGLLASTAMPAAATIPGTKAIHDSKGQPFAGLPDPAPGTSLALAFGDLADLQMKLGDTAGGWATQRKAMQILRSVTPSPATTHQLVVDCNNNANSVRSQLDTALKLGGDGAKRLLAVSQYRVQCEVIDQLATERFAIQQSLLRRSIRYGLHQEVWTYIKEMKVAEMDEQEPYGAQSTLLTNLYYTTYFGGNKGFAEKTYNEYDSDEKKAVSKAESTTGTLAAALAVARAGDGKKAADTLKPLYVGTSIDRHVIDHDVLSLVGELSGKSLNDDYAFIKRLALADPTIKEDSFRLTAGWSITKNQGPAFWKLMEPDRELTSTDLAHIYLGYLEGIQATGAK